ncbi:MAG: aspartate carbamoyltransferase regulatory subunit [Deltaproteobacteria bacterium]|nr:aspartate carbamoyltransferase regulatory subunit [Deltaproteobacteria bacterium]
MTEKTLLIPKIESGIVIDHIPAGLGLKVLEIIHSYPEMSAVVTSVGLNYSSSKIAKKDMIKLQTQALPPRLMQHLAMAAPGVSVKRVERYRVVEKLVITVPETIVGTARCRNPGCITNHERDVVTRFSCVDPGAKRFRCSFCEGIFPIHELEVIVPSLV